MGRAGHQGQRIRGKGSGTGDWGRGSGAGNPGQGISDRGSATGDRRGQGIGGRGSGARDQGQILILEQYTDRHNKAPYQI